MCRYVDLEVQQPVIKVVLYLRTDCCTAQYRNIEIRVGNTPATPSTPPSQTGNALCWSQGAQSVTDVAPGGVLTADCPASLGGRYVSVHITTPEGSSGNTGGDDVLSLCEVGAERPCKLETYLPDCKCAI